MRKVSGLTINGFVLFAVATTVGLLNGCATAPRSESKREELQENVTVSMATLQEQDPTLKAFVDHGYGHVLFPTVGKGAWVVGGAYGRGTVFENDMMIGYADITQASIGVQGGGQTFSELIVFENKEALERFKGGKLKFDANVSAVALKSGAAATTKFDDGVAIFVRPTAGLMVEASVGGQSFSFQPKQ